MKEKYVDDISEVKDILHRSTRTITLNGLYGISAGLIALMGAYVAKLYVFNNQSFISNLPSELTTESQFKLIIISLCTFLAAASLAFFITKRTTKEDKRTNMSSQSKKLLYHLLIPLLTGGVICILLISMNLVQLIPGMSLSFYGIALISTDKYTFSDLNKLGLAQIILGILAVSFLKYGMVLWMTGFGILHIVYGLFIQYGAKS